MVAGHDGTRGSSTRSTLCLPRHVGSEDTTTVWLNGGGDDAEERPDTDAESEGDLLAPAAEESPEVPEFVDTPEPAEAPTEEPGVAAAGD